MPPRLVRSVLVKHLIPPPAIRRNNQSVSIMKLSPHPKVNAGCSALHCVSAISRQHSLDHTFILCSILTLNMAILPITQELLKLNASVVVYMQGQFMTPTTSNSTVSSHPLPNLILYFTSHYWFVLHVLRTPQHAPLYNSTVANLSLCKHSKHATSVRHLY